MACGTPVLCPNVSSLPEIVGDAAIHINPTDTEGWITGIKAILEKPDLNKKMIKSGLIHIKRHDWKSITQEYEDFTKVSSDNVKQVFIGEIVFSIISNLEIDNLFVFR